MGIRISEEFLEKIKKNYDEKVRYNNLDLKVDNSIGNATVYKRNWAVCEIDEISDMIEQLTMLRDAIKEETGFEF